MMRIKERIRYLLCIFTALLLALPHTADAQINVCEGKKVTLQGKNYAGGKVQWQRSPDGSSWSNINGGITLSYTFTVSESGFFRLQIIDSTCEQITLYSEVHEVVVDPVPETPGPVTGPVNVCENETGVTYAIDAVPDADAYTWSVPAGATITGGQGTTSITVDFAASGGQVCVVADNDNCSSKSRCKGVDVITSPPPQPGAIDGNPTPCQDETGVHYFIFPVSGATGYTWTVPSPGATLASGQGTGSINVDYGSTTGNIGDICVTADNQCFSSSPTCLSITVDTIPNQAGPISGPTTPCEYETGVTYTINSVTFANAYNWTVPPGAIITSGQGDTTITVDFDTTGGDICVTVDNFCGNSAPRCLTLNFLDTVPPQPDPITGPTAPCAGNTSVSYSIPSVPEALDYTWSVPPDATITGGQGTTSITVDFDSLSGNVCVTANDTCGSSVPRCLYVYLPPNTPNATAATNVYSEGFTANWDSVSGADDYLLDIAYDSLFNNFVPGYQDTSVGAVAFFTAGLPNCDTNYYYRVRAVNPCDTSSYSDTVSVWINCCIYTPGDTLQFTNCGQDGRTGPSQTQCDAEYSGTNLDGEVTVNAGIQEWTVPCNGTYRITAAGARGGNATSGPPQGNGAIMTGDFSLDLGEVIWVLVGQQGEDRNNSAGGGGGTFVTKDPHNTKNSILIIAGGGGASSADFAGIDATTDTCGTFDAQSGPEQCNGDGGISFTGNSGSGGGGFFTDGDGGGIGDGGKSYVSGGLGGTTNNQQEGGFGGGGGQDGSGTYAASAGGGYSGGNGGNRNSTVGTGRMGGGGGGSWNAGTNQNNQAGANAGHGYVIIVYTGP